VYRAIITGIVTPTILYALKWIQYWSLQAFVHQIEQQRQSSMMQSSSRDGKQPEEEENASTTTSQTTTLIHENQSRRLQWIFQVATTLSPPSWKVINMKEIKYLQENSLLSEGSKEKIIEFIEYALNDAEKIFRNQKFLRQRILISFLTDFTILLSYGTLFPPLGFLLVLSMAKDLFLWQMMVGRLVAWSMEIENDENIIVVEKLSAIISNINLSLQGIDQSILNFLIIMLILCSSLWSFCLFDTLGDEVGAVKSIWIVIVMVLAPYVILIIYAIVGKLFAKAEQVNIKRQSSRQSSSRREEKIADIELLQGNFTYTRKYLTIKNT
jgi:hypothetical protein